MYHQQRGRTCMVYRHGEYSTCRTLNITSLSSKNGAGFLSLVYWSSKFKILDKKLFLINFPIQEAIAVGIYNCLRPQDDVITSYRAHGYAYLMGGKNLEPLIAELIGAKTGFSKGKGGSVHIYTDRFYGGNGIVGAQVGKSINFCLGY